MVEFTPGELTWIKAAALPGPALIESHKASAQNCAKKHSIATRSGLTVRKEMHMLLVAHMWHVGKCVRTASNNEQPSVKCLSIVHNVQKTKTTTCSAISTKESLDHK